MGDYVKTVFAYTEDTWTKVFQQNGMQYEQPKMVLFTGGVEQVVAVPHQHRDLFIAQPIIKYIWIYSF